MARESIYNLVPEQYVEQAKPPMYRLRHDPTVREEIRHYFPHVLSDSQPPTTFTPRSCRPP